MPLWEKASSDGTVIVDGSGSGIDCADHPCGDCVSGPHIDIISWRARTRHTATGSSVIWSKAPPDFSKRQNVGQHPEPNTSLKCDLAGYYLDGGAIAGANFGLLTQVVRDVRTGKDLCTRWQSPSGLLEYKAQGFTASSLGVFDTETYQSVRMNPSVLLNTYDSTQRWFCVFQFQFSFGGPPPTDRHVIQIRDFSSGEIISQTYLYTPSALQIRALYMYPINETVCYAVFRDVYGSSFARIMDFNAGDAPLSGLDLGSQTTPPQSWCNNNNGAAFYTNRDISDSYPIGAYRLVRSLIDDGAPEIDGCLGGTDKFKPFADGLTGFLSNHCGTGGGGRFYGVEYNRIARSTGNSCTIGGDPDLDFITTFPFAGSNIRFAYVIRDTFPGGDGYDPIDPSDLEVAPCGNSCDSVYRNPKHACLPVDDDIDEGDDCDCNYIEDNECLEVNLTATFSDTFAACPACSEESNPIEDCCDEGFALCLSVTGGACLSCCTDVDSIVSLEITMEGQDGVTLHGYELDTDFEVLLADGCGGFGPPNTNSPIFDRGYIACVSFNEAAIDGSYFGGIDVTATVTTANGCTISVTQSVSIFASEP